MKHAQAHRRIAEDFSTKDRPYLVVVPRVVAKAEV